MFINYIENVDTISYIYFLILELEQINDKPKENNFEGSGQKGKVRITNCIFSK